MAKRHIAIFAIALAAIAAGVSVWRSTSIREGSAYIDDDADIELQEKRFDALVQKVKSYLMDNDGWLPADPYKALLLSGSVESSQDFFPGFDIVRFEFLSLPPRLNPNLALNRRAVLFWYLHRERSEKWICFMDGTWVREPARSSPSYDAAAQMKWRDDFHRAGYPYWKSVRDKAEWIERNRSNLVWDPELKLYVPQGDRGLE